ncbi:MAG: sugar phosphate isomerase/epimerase family protein [Fimbriimonas sp.]
MRTISAFADEISPDLGVQIETLSRLGLQGLDLRSVGGVNVLQLTDAQVVEVREAVAAAGLVVQCVGSPVNKVVLSETSRVEELAKLVRACEVAKLLGTQRIRVFTPEAPAEAYDEVAAWMRAQIDLATAFDVVLIHENDAKFYGAYPDQAKRLFEDLGGPHFRAVFDFANAVLLGTSPLDDWLPWIVPYLDTLHIKDAKDGRVVPAGQGDGQIGESLRLLFAQGWSGPLTLEPHLQAAGPMGGFSGVQLFEVATQALRDVLAEVDAA